MSIRRQATLCNRDANDLFLAIAKDLKCDNVTHAHVEHHIDDVILTSDFGRIAVYVCTHKNVTRLQYAVCERSA